MYIASTALWNVVWTAWATRSSSSSCSNPFRFETKFHNLNSESIYVFCYVCPTHVFIYSKPDVQRMSSPYSSTSPTASSSTLDLTYSVTARKAPSVCTLGKSQIPVPKFRANPKGRWIRFDSMFIVTKLVIAWNPQLVSYSRRIPAH